MLVLTLVAFSAWSPAQGLLAPIRALDRSGFDAALAAGADLEERDEFGQTPLMYAVTLRQIGLTTALLEAGADVHARTTAGWTALHYAAREAHAPALVDLLVAAGASLAARTEAGETPWVIAVAQGNEVAIDALRAARRVQEDGDRWFRVLGVPLPAGPVNGVTLSRRSVAADGSLGPANDVHVWVFSDRRRPLRDEKVLILDDGARLRIERYWTLDERGRVQAIETLTNGVAATAEVEATEETLEIVERTTTVTTTSRYAFDGVSGNLSGSRTVSTTAGSLTPRIAIAYDQDGASTTTSTTLDGEESSRVERDDTNFLRSTWAPAPFPSERTEVVARDAYGNPLQAKVTDAHTGRVTHQIDVAYAYGPKPDVVSRSVRVVTDALRVRSRPGADGARVTAQVGGAAGVLISETPTWADGFWWWHVRFDDGSVGWVANGDANGHWLGNAVGRAWTTPARPPAARANPGSPSPAASGRSTSEGLTRAQREEQLRSSRLAIARGVAGDPGVLIQYIVTPRNYPIPDDSPFVALWYEMPSTPPPGGDRANFRVVGPTQVAAMRVFIVHTTTRSFCRWDVPRTVWTLNGAHFSNMGWGGRVGNIPLQAYTTDFGARDGSLGRFLFGVTADDRCLIDWSPL